MEQKPPGGQDLDKQGLTPTQEVERQLRESTEQSRQMEKLSLQEKEQAFVELSRGVRSALFQNEAFVAAYLAAKDRNLVRFDLPDGRVVRVESGQLTTDGGIEGIDDLRISIRKQMDDPEQESTKRWHEDTLGPSAKKFDKDLALIDGGPRKSEGVFEEGHDASESWPFGRFNLSYMDKDVFEVGTNDDKKSFSIYRGPRPVDGKRIVLGKGRELINELKGNTSPAPISAPASAPQV